MRVNHTLAKPNSTMPNQRAKNKKRIGLYVHEDTLKVLKREAEKLGVPLNEYLIRLAEEKSGKTFKR